MKTRLDARPWLWLLLGGLLVVGANFRFGIPLLGWLAPIPWLRYLRLTSGWRSRALLLAALLVAWTVAVAKIITPPIPPFMAILSAPMVVVHGAPLLLWSWLRRRLSPFVSATAFAAAVALVDYGQFSWTELGTWSSLAYTQLDDLLALQWAALVGMSGLSFTVALVAALLESVLEGEGRRPLVAAGAVLVTVHAFGALRLAEASTTVQPTIKVAAVSSDRGEITPEPPTKTPSCSAWRARPARCTPTWWWATWCR